VNRLDLPIIQSLVPIRQALSKGHTVIAGQTQYGKTTAALAMFYWDIFDKRTNPLHLFIDTKHDDAIPKHGVMVKNMSELRLQISMKTKRVIYRPPGDEGRVAELTKIIDYLFRLKDDNPPKKGHRNRPIIIFIDEIQLYAGNQSKHSGLQRLATTGLGKKVIMVALGQRIQDMNKQMYSQCNNTICFFMRERREYLRTQGMEEIADVAIWLRDHPYYFAYLFAGDDQLRIHNPLPLPGQNPVLNKLLGLND
jgi:hypothetical protein